MIENNTNQPAQEEQQAPAEMAGFNPFDEGAWVEQPAPDVPRETITEETPKTEAQTETPAQEAAKEEAPKPWYADFGFESEEAAKTEIQTLRESKDKAPTAAEIQFANEQSQTLFNYLKEGKETEVLQFLSRKQQLAQVETMPAEAALRLHIEQTHPHYKAEDVADVMEEKYGLPPKPVMEAHEDEEDFAVRETAYNNQVAKVQRRMERDAFAAREELKKINQELVLPEIGGKTPEAQAPAQSSAEVEAIRQQYLQSLDQHFQKFTGFQVTYKDEAVELPIPFAVTPEEAQAQRDALRNFDHDAYFASRWIGQDGQYNVEQMMADKYLLENRDKVFQKLVSEAVNQRLAHERKNKANIQVNGPSGTFNPGAQDQNKEMAEHFFSN
jgi:hypothetical protein